MKAALHALRARYFRSEFNRQAARMAHTPPLAAGSAPLTALSMLHPRDLMQYLIAIKSFHRYLPAERIVVVADPELNESHVRQLRDHVPQLEVLAAESFRHPKLPVGGCWERLAAICRLREEGYIVQLDADTLTRAPLDEVESCARRNESFLLSTEDGQRIGGVAQARAHAERILAQREYLQYRCEANLTALVPLGVARYMRGCAGFSGFMRAPDSTRQLVQLSEAMSAQMPERWSSWGTEQFASNVLVCNDPGASALPHPKYCSPDVVTSQTAFIHFVGYLRHRSGLYARQTRQLVAELGSRAGADRIGAARIHRPNDREAA